MADNIIAPAIGAQLATDEIAGVHYPRNKVVFGGDGEATDIAADNPLPVADDAVEEAIQSLAQTLAAAHFYPDVQPVSVATLPLPAGAATDAKVEAVRALLAGTITVSVGSLPLPAGAATAAKQDSLNTLFGLTTPADDLFAITPGTAAIANPPKALLVTAAGTLSVGGSSNTAVSLGSVAVGQIIPLRARYVYATGTTATVVGLV